MRPDLLNLPALSIRQPWAWLVVRPDLTDPDVRNARCKNIENRVWKRSFRGRFLIHASAGMTKKEFGASFQTAADVLDGFWAPPRPQGPELKFGGIIGAATIVDMLNPIPNATHDMRWPWHFPAQYGYVLEDIEPLPFIPCKGALGFFKPDLTNFQKSTGQTSEIQG